MIRIFKLSAYNSALEDLINAIKEEKKSFISALYILAIAIVLSSSLMYYAKMKLNLISFPQFLPLCIGLL